MLLILPGIYLGYATLTSGVNKSREQGMGGMAHCKRKNDEVIVVFVTYGSFRGVWAREIGRKLIFYIL